MVIWFLALFRRLERLVTLGGYVPPYMAAFLWTSLGVGWVGGALFARSELPGQPGFHEHWVTAMTWQRCAPEYKALCYQAFNAASMSLSRQLARSQTEMNRPWAVVVDIDDTLFDTSDFTLSLMARHQPFTVGAWHAWTAAHPSRLVPGGLEFCRYAHERGVEVHYLSNRDVVQKADTLRELRRWNFPFADEAHLWLRNHTSSKRARRQEIQKTHRVAVFIGDALADLDHKFEDNPEEHVRSARHEFGQRFVALPNPVYGPWNQNHHALPRTRWRRLLSTLKNVT